MTDGLVTGMQEVISGVVSNGSLSSVVSGALNPLEKAVPDFVLNVQHVSVASDFASFLVPYFPFVEGYSDVEILVLGACVLVWMFCAVWTLRDAMARSDSSFYQFFSVLLVVVLSPVIGLPLYLAFRPLVYKRERGFWRESLEQHIVVCAHCDGLNSDTHKVCVWCGEPLQVVCKECHTHYLNDFSYCPECGAPNLD